MKTRTTEEQRKLLHEFLTNRIVDDDDPYRRISYSVACQALLDLDDVLFRLETVESRLRAAHDGVSGAERSISALLLETAR